MSLQHPERIEDILLQDRLFFAAPSLLNDPFEGRINANTSASFNEKRRFYFEKVKAQLGVSDREACRITDEWLSTGKHEDPRVWAGEVAALTEQSRDGFLGVVCLTPHDRNLLMWSHYADGHRGVCLQFRNTGLISTAMRVKYSQEYPEIRFFYGSSMYDQTVAFLLTKSNSWSYEDEYRLLKIAGINNGKLAPTERFDPQLLTGLILGSEISSKNEKLIRDLISRRTQPLSLLKAERDETSYEVRFRQRRR